MLANVGILHRLLRLRGAGGQNELPVGEFQRVIDPVERIETGVRVLKHRLDVLAKLQRLRSPHALHIAPFKEHMAL